MAKGFQVQNIGIGGNGYASYAVESDPGGSGTPGVEVTPNLYLPMLTHNVQAQYDMVSPRVMRGTPLTRAIMERARIKAMGPVEWELNASEGMEYFTAALGSGTTISIGTPTITTASTTTDAGLSTITVAGSWDTKTFQWVAINTASSGATNADVVTANTELRMVTPQSTSGSLIVGELKANAEATTGIYVTVLAQSKAAFSLIPDGYTNALGTLTTEWNRGRQWAMRFAKTFIDKIDVDLSKDEFKVTADVFASATPKILTPTGGEAWSDGAYVGYAPNAGTEANALRPLTSIDGMIVVGGDPHATGASATCAALGVQNVKISYNNALLQEALFNGEATYEAIPSDNRECTVEYEEISTSKRPSIWMDFIRESNTTSFMVQCVKNLGSLSAPNIEAVGFGIPVAKFSDSASLSKIGSSDAFQNKLTALAPPGSGAQDYLVVHYVVPA